MRTSLPWLIALLSLLGLGLAVYGYLGRGAEIAALKNQAEKVSSSSAVELGKLRAELAEVKKARRARASANSSERAARDPKGDAATRDASRTGRVQGAFDFDKMRRDPAYAWIWRKQQLRNVQRQYGDAIAAMKLPADEAARLRDLLVERTDAMADARDVAQQAGLSPRETRLAVSQANDGVNGEISALIGADGLSQLNQPQTGMFKGMIAGSVGVDLEMAGSPLTPAQTTALAQAFAEGMRASFPGGGPANQTPDPGTGLTPVFQSILDHMTPSLAPEQVPAVKSYLLEQVQQQQYFRKTTAASHNP